MNGTAYPHRDATTPPEFSVVIPVFNNAATLSELIDRLVRVLESIPITFELIFVDDGSRDDSLTILQRHAAADSRIRPFALTRNFASQAAVCAGFDQVRGRLAMCMDADLENLPEDIPRLLEPLGRGYDLVCGYREARPRARLLPSRIINAYVRHKTGTQIRDLGCGMRAFESWVVQDLAADGEKRRLLTPLFLERARRVTEVPLRVGTARHATPPKGRAGHSYLTLLGIAADYFLLTARRPFLVLGIAFGLVGGTVSLVMSALDPLTAMVTLASAWLGVLGCLLGEYCQRLYHLSQGTPFFQLRDLDHEAAAISAPKAYDAPSTVAHQAGAGSEPGC